jgi:uncharacterized membrane protein YoaK (UPF0700 family)
MVSALLSFTAGYVDACMFLALVGLFVAQVTGSFVMIGAALVTHEDGLLIKVLAIPIFFAAGFATTIFAAVLRGSGRSALLWVLALESALLVSLLAVGAAFGIPRDLDAPAALLAAMLGLSAMGVQSAAVRLLLPTVASTNVMTTNTTLFAIDTGELLLGWWRKRDDPVAAEQFTQARARLSVLMPIGIGFLAGTAAGAVGHMLAGLWCLLVVVATLAGIIVWAARG